MTGLSPTTYMRAMFLILIETEMTPATELDPKKVKRRKRQVEAFGNKAEEAIAELEAKAARYDAQGEGR